MNVMEGSSGSSPVVIVVAAAFVFALCSSVGIILCVLKRNRKGRYEKDEQHMIGHHAPAEHVLPDSPESEPISPEMEMMEEYQEEGIQETRALPSNGTTTAGLNAVHRGDGAVDVMITPQYDNADSGDELESTESENDAITLQTTRNNDMIVTPQDDNAESGNELSSAESDEDVVTLQSATNGDLIVTPEQPTAK